MTSWQLSPKVSSISPANEALHGSQPIVITFSRPMDPESVESRLTFSVTQPGDFLWSEDLKRVTFQPFSTWPAGETLILEFSSGARSRLRLPLIGSIKTEIPISPILLVYLWPADGPSNLYLANPVSGESWALTSEDGGVLDYSIFTEKEQIFYSTREDDGSQIKVLDRISGTTETIVECRARLCTSPQISPDGTYLAYEVIPQEPDTSPTILIEDLQTGVVSDQGTKNHYLETPLWSPEGWLAYYNRTLLAYQFWDPTSDEIRTLPNETGGTGSWSPDGRYFITSEILFLSDTLAPRHLILYDLREETTLDLSRGSYPEDLNPRFAPDGMVLAYSHKSLDPQLWTPGRELWIIDVSTGDNTQLTETVDFHHTSFAWHPDGDLLAFVRYNQAALSEPPEIWQINRDGSEPLRLIINGFQPGWIP